MSQLTFGTVAPAFFKVRVRTCYFRLSCSCDSNFEVISFLDFDFPIGYVSWLEFKVADGVFEISGRCHT
jgi:hypothetical protein